MLLGTNEKQKYTGIKMTIVILSHRTTIVETGVEVFMYIVQ